jgi:hypothetical protein
MVKLELVLHPDEASLVLQAIEKARAAGYQAALTAKAEEGRVSAEAPLKSEADLSAETSGGRVRASDADVSVSRADALMLMAESFLKNGVGPGGSGSDRYQVFIHLDQDVLGADDQWAAVLDDGTRLSGEALRRVACDAALVPTLTDAHNDMLSVGRRTRVIPPAIRRALWLRDRGCRFPGCQHTRFLHGHHIQHWLHGGATSLDNLILFCPRHHHLVHEGGFTIERPLTTGALSFRAPTGALLPANPPRETIENAVEWLRTWAADHDLEIGADTNLPWWDGAVPDYDWAVSSLLAGS